MCRLGPRCRAGCVQSTWAGRRSWAGLGSWHRDASDSCSLMECMCERERGRERERETHTERVIEINR